MCESLADVRVHEVYCLVTSLPDRVAIKHHSRTILRLHEEVFKGLKSVIVHVCLFKG